jgi:hypothetical protein
MNANLRRSPRVFLLLSLQARDEGRGPRAECTRTGTSPSASATEGGVLGGDA